MPPTTSRGPVLNQDRFNEARRAAGYTTNDQLAKAAGTTGSTIGRLIAGTVAPSGSVIAGLLRALPGAKFEDLFQIPE